MLRMLTAQIAATLAAFLLMIAATLTERAFAADLELRGGGSTFVAPLVNGWIKQFESAQPHIGVRYDAVGSGEGIFTIPVRLRRFCGKRQSPFALKRKEDRWRRRPGAKHGWPDCASL